MNKTCKVCGHSGENLWNDGRYFCANCGSEIDVTAPDEKNNAAPTGAACPVCQNDKNIGTYGEKLRCPLCGTKYTERESREAARRFEASSDSSYTRDNSYNSYTEELSELQRQKNSNIIIGVVLLFFFWPASIYFFYKAYSISKEISEQ